MEAHAISQLPTSTALVPRRWRREWLFSTVNASTVATPSTSGPIKLSRVGLTSTICRNAAVRLFQDAPAAQPLAKLRSGLLVVWRGEWNTRNLGDQATSVLSMYKGGQMVNDPFCSRRDMFRYIHTAFLSFVTFSSRCPSPTVSAIHEAQIGPNGCWIDSFRQECSILTFPLSPRTTNDLSSNPLLRSTLIGNAARALFNQAIAVVKIIGIDISVLPIRVEEICLTGSGIRVVDCILALAHHVDCSARGVVVGTAGPGGRTCDAGVAEIWKDQGRDKSCVLHGCRSRRWCNGFA